MFKGRVTAERELWVDVEDSSTVKCSGSPISALCHSVSACSSLVLQKLTPFVLSGCYNSPPQTWRRHRSVPLAKSERRNGLGKYKGVPMSKNIGSFEKDTTEKVVASKDVFVGTEAS